MANPAGPPLGSSLIQLDENNPLRKDPFILAKEWAEWGQSEIFGVVQSVSRVVKTIPLIDPPQSAAIPTSSAFLTTGPGLYEVSYLIRVVTPASGSSSLQVTVTWVRDGVTLTAQGSLVNGNAVTTYESPGPLLIRVDGLTDITYAVAYTSVGTPLQFEFDIVVKQIG